MSLGLIEKLLKTSWRVMYYEAAACEGNQDRSESNLNAAPANPQVVRCGCSLAMLAPHVAG